MKFHIDSTGLFYDKKEDRDRLQKLGFKFEPDSTFSPDKIHMRKVSQNKDSGYLYIEINNLEELLKFIDKHGSIICHGSSIIIFDDYC